MGETKTNAEPNMFRLGYSKMGRLPIYTWAQLSLPKPELLLPSTICFHDRSPTLRQNALQILQMDTNHIV